jgi:hypothetical protein
VLGSWCLLTLVLTAAYSGTLIAFLSVNTKPRLFSSTRDLLADPHGYAWGTMGNVSLQIMLQV